MFRIACFIFLIFGPNSGFAGAWPREKGEVFVSFSHSHSLSWGGGYPSAYAEWGVRRGFTLGLEVGGTGVAQNAMAFLRLHPKGERKLVSAVEMGIGTEGPGRDTVVSSGMLAGIGFKTPLGPAWVDARGVARLNLRTGAQTAKLDTTLGMKTRRGVLYMLELNGKVDAFGQISAHLAPSAAVPLNKKLHIQFGVSQGIFNTREQKVKLALWASF
ncbi:MAG: hypothetical protein ACWA47_08025 [Brevirhabdus sp.]